MTEETKRKLGRPATGVLSPLENKQALIAAGGRIMQYRIKAGPNLALKAIEQSGEFKTTTEALDRAIVDFAVKRKLFKK